MLSKTDILHILTGCLIGLLLILFVSTNLYVFLVVSIAILSFFLGWQVCERFYEIEPLEETLNDFMELAIGLAIGLFIGTLLLIIF